MNKEQQKLLKFVGKLYRQIRQYSEEQGYTNMEDFGTPKGLIIIGWTKNGEAFMHSLGLYNLEDIYNCFQSWFAQRILTRKSGDIPYVA